MVGVAICQERAEASSAPISEQELQLLIAEKSLASLGENHPARARVAARVESLRSQLNATAKDASAKPNESSSSPVPAPSSKTQAIVAPERTLAKTKAFQTAKAASYPSRRQLTPNDLRMIGGYRIPPALLWGKSMAFSHCGLTGRHEVNGQLRLWMSHHATTTAVAEFVAPKARGTDLKDIKRWPVCEHVRNIDKVYAELYALDNACQIHGVHWSPERNRLLVSGRSWYNTTGGKDNWLVQVSVDEPAVIEPGIAPGLSQQAFGGGFVDIPKEFADAFCGGNTIGLSKGGYESGQASATSPTLAAYGASDVSVLMECKWNAPASERERRDDNYDPGNVGWQPKPVDGKGFFGVDRVMDTAWVKNGDLESFIAIVLQPVGKLNYALQGDVFTGKNVQYSLYVYDPVDFARVASGELLPHQVRGTWYPFPEIPVSLNRPKGLWFDVETKHLNIVYANAWSPGGPESYPVVIEYEIPDA
jgi:hypothetical protein